MSTFDATGVTASAVTVRLDRADARAVLDVLVDALNQPRRGRSVTETAGLVCCAAQIAAQTQAREAPTGPTGRCGAPQRLGRPERPKPAPAGLTGLGGGSSEVRR